MSRKGPPVCKRRGCERPRSSWQFACADCWREVPYAEQQRYLRAARAKLTGIKAKISREILRALGSKPATTPHSVQAYHRIAAMVGERAEADSAS